MDRREVRELLEQVAQGIVGPEAATDRLASGPLRGVHDIGFARVDTHRALRTGDPEVVYGAGKSPSQIVDIVAALQAAESVRPTLVTRAEPEAVAALEDRLPQATADGGTVRSSDRFRRRAAGWQCCPPAPPTLRWLRRPR